MGETVATESNLKGMWYNLCLAIPSDASTPGGGGFGSRSQFVATYLRGRLFTSH